MAQRRTNDEMFDLGAWCGAARAEIHRVMDDDAPKDVLALLRTLGDFLRVAQDARNWTALSELQSLWDVNHGNGAEWDGSEPSPGAVKVTAAIRGTRLHKEPGE
jgi:hypothetical protein